MKINLIEYFESTVDLFPDKLAIYDDTSYLSFKELEQKSKSIATQISKKNGSINKPIAIYLPKKMIQLFHLLLLCTVEIVMSL